MSSLRIPPPSSPPPNSPPSSGPPPGASTGGRWGPVAVAGLILASSLIAGIWLASSGPEAGNAPSAQELTANAQHSAYGGDAYTGIQNAAADTEHAVVAGSNTVAELAADLHEDAMAADDARWGHLYDGLALLIIMLGAANFVLVWQRSVMPPR